MRGENRGLRAIGSSESGAKAGGPLGSRQAGQQESSFSGSTSGRSEDWAEGCEPLHQRIAELAYILYERSGFQDGKDVEHWLEAERQIKAVRGLAA
ncbi:MAG: DUF2934 domain-containing protein [Nitrospira sp.]|nr:DUF2934 domain-containing protein [Nitrospira sp.]